MTKIHSVMCEVCKGKGYIGCDTDNICYKCDGQGYYTVGKKSSYVFKPEITD